MSADQVSAPDVEALYCDHHGWLSGWLRRKLGNSFDAADLVQDTFVRVLRGREPAAIREPRAYLAAIANGLVVSHWRRRALEQAYLATLAAQPEPLVPSLEQQALILETLEDIAFLLDGLPARTREIFLFSQIDRLTYPQIAWHPVSRGSLPENPLQRGTPSWPPPGRICFFYRSQGHDCPHAVCLPAAGLDGGA